MNTFKVICIKIDDSHTYETEKDICFLNVHIKPEDK